MYCTFMSDYKPIMEMQKPSSINDNTANDFIEMYMALVTRIQVMRKRKIKLSLLFQHL